MHASDWEQILCYVAKFRDERTLNRHLHEVGYHRRATTSKHCSRRRVELRRRAWGNSDATTAPSRWDLRNYVRGIRVKLLELAVELVVTVLRNALEDVPARSKAI